MKARVIETGELIEVKRLYPTIYSRLDKNNRIAEEYYDDEIELIDKPKMIAIEKACKWLEENMSVVNATAVNYGDISFATSKIIGGKENFLEQFKKAMEG